MGQEDVFEAVKWYLGISQKKYEIYKAAFYPSSNYLISLIRVLCPLRKDLVEHTVGGKCFWVGKFVYPKSSDLKHDLIKALACYGEELSEYVMPSKRDAFVEVCNALKEFVDCSTLRSEVQVNRKFNCAYIDEEWRECFVKKVEFAGYNVHLKLENRSLISYFCDLTDLPIFWSLREEVDAVLKNVSEKAVEAKRCNEAVLKRVSDALAPWIAAKSV